MKDPDGSMDYGRPGSWDRIASLLSGTFEPRPSSRCGRVECEPGWNWHPRLSDYDLWLPVEGSGHLRVCGSTYAIRPGTLFFLRPGDEGHATQDPDDRLTVVFVHFDFFAPGGQRGTGVEGRWLPPRCVPLQESVQLDALLTRVVRLMEQSQRLAEVEAKLNLQQSLIEIYRQDAVRHGLAPVRLDPRIARVVTYLKSYPSRRLDLEESARLAGLSSAYFSRLFKKEVGRSFRAYALQARLERARHLLEETEMTVGEIAQALGYDEVFLFSRQFKQHYGRPPSRIRRE